MKPQSEQKSHPILSKLVLLMVVLFINAFIVMSFSSQIISFYNQDNPFNITLDAWVDTNHYLPIPRYAYIENITISTLVHNFSDRIIQEQTDEAEIYFNPPARGHGVCFNISQDINLSILSIQFNNSNIHNVSGVFKVHIYNASNNPYIPDTEIYASGYYDKENYTELKYYNFSIPYVYMEESTPYCYALTYNSTSNVIWFNFYRDNIALENNRIANTTGWADDGGDESYTYKLYEKSLGLEIGLGEEKLFYNNTYIGQFNYSELNTTYINNVLLSSCNCSNCSIEQNNCLIPLTFYSDTQGILQVNLTNATYSYGIDNCTNSYGIPSNGTALNISYLDNQSNKIFVEHNTFMTYTDSNFSQNSVDLQNQSYCVYPSWFNYTIDQEIEYIYNGIVFNYFLDNYLLNNITKTLNLYASASTTQVLFTVLDRGTEIEGAYIHILKYNVGTGTYTTTEILKTDSQGQAIGNIILGTTFYNFLVYYGGELVYTDIGAKLISTTRTFNINLIGTEWLDNFGNMLGINTNLYYNNETYNFVFTWSDPTGEMHYGCMRVDKRNNSGKYALIDNCTQTTSGTIIYNIAPLYNGSEYIATAYMKYDYEIIVDRIAYKVASIKDYFQEKPLPSLFLAWMFILVMFLIGIPNPVIAVTLLGAGTIVTWSMGMVFLPITQIGAIIILIIIQIYLAGRQNS